MAGPVNELLKLRRRNAELLAELHGNEVARLHLRQQSNELKGVAIALVRKLREAQAASEAKLPVLIKRAAWLAQTESPEAKAGKGVVLQVIPVERDVMAAEPLHPDAEEGDILVDVGDLEQIESAKVERPS